MKKFSRREFIPLAGLTLLSASCISANSKANLLQQTKRTPKKLSKGDTIGVCAPAGAIKHTSEIDDFTHVLENLGFKVKMSPNVGGRFGYFSGTDEERAEDFMTLIKDDSISGIFFIRGGWGAARILEHLDFDVIRDNPKVIMGFSDITTLLNVITTKCDLITFHGPGGNSSWNTYSVDYIKRLLMKAENVTFENHQEDPIIKTLSPGKAFGELFGGNLSVLSGLMGSEYIPNLEGKILFLEDVMEEPYRIDRMLTQLRLASVFDQAEGIVLGAFRKCVPEEPEYSFTLEEVFEQHFKGFNKPVFSGAQFGHTKNKFTLPVGAEVEIDAEKGTIQMLGAAVHH